MGSGSGEMKRLIPKGLSVRSRTQATWRFMSAGWAYAKPNEPSAPAPEHAATSSCELGPPAIGAWMMGRRIPSLRANGVMASRAKAKSGTDHVFWGPPREKGRKRGLSLIFGLSFGFGEQLAADQPAADLGSAGADLVELGVAPQAPGGRFVDVAHAAERLDRLAGHPGGFLGRIQDRPGGVLARGFAAVQRLPYRIHIGTAGGEGGVHVGELALHQLEFADRLAELLALVHVGHYHVQAGGH